MFFAIILEHLSQFFGIVLDLKHFPFKSLVNFNLFLVNFLNLVDS